MQFGRDHPLFHEELRHMYIPELPLPVIPVMAREVPEFPVAPEVAVVPVAVPEEIGVVGVRARNGLPRQD